MGPIDGIINFHKPVGITSARAVDRVRALTGQRKSGHAGTLDPGASGVLLMCLGRATTLVERIMDLPKVYRATARLDVTSDSFDSDRPLVPVQVNRVPTAAELEAACRSFEGVIQQVPPLISAIKVGGTPAYKRAARGQAVVLAARPVTVYSMRILDYCWPSLEFEVRCGRGTYVRALIRDLGERLGTGGCLTSLVRTAVGPFTLETSWTPDRMQQAEVSEYLVSLERAAELIKAAACTRE